MLDRRHERAIRGSASTMIPRRRASSAHAAHTFTSIRSLWTRYVTASTLQHRWHFIVNLHSGAGSLVHGTDPESAGFVGSTT